MALPCNTVAQRHKCGLHRHSPPAGGCSQPRTCLVSFCTPCTCHQMKAWVAGRGGAAAAWHEVDMECEARREATGTVQAALGMPDDTHANAHCHSIYLVAGGRHRDVHRVALHLPKLRGVEGKQHGGASPGHGSCREGSFNTRPPSEPSVVAARQTQPHAADCNQLHPAPPIPMPDQSALTLNTSFSVSSHSCRLAFMSPNTGLMVWQSGASRSCTAEGPPVRQAWQAAGTRSLTECDHDRLYMAAAGVRKNVCVHGANAGCQSCQRQHPNLCVLKTHAAAIPR